MLDNPTRWYFSSMNFELSKKIKWDFHLHAYEFGLKWSSPVYQCISVIPIVSYFGHCCMHNVPVILCTVNVVYTMYFVLSVMQLLLLPSAPYTMLSTIYHTGCYSCCRVDRLNTLAWLNPKTPRRKRKKALTDLLGGTTHTLPVFS